MVGDTVYRYPKLVFASAKVVTVLTTKLGDEQKIVTGIPAKLYHLTLDEFKRFQKEHNLTPVHYFTDRPSWIRTDEVIHKRYTKTVVDNVQEYKLVKVDKQRTVEVERKEKAIRFEEKKERVLKKTLAQTVTETREAERKDVELFKPTVQKALLQVLDDLRYSVPTNEFGVVMESEINRRIEEAKEPFLRNFDYIGLMKLKQEYPDFSTERLAKIVLREQKESQGLGESWHLKPLERKSEVKEEKEDKKVEPQYEEVTRKVLVEYYETKKEKKIEKFQVLERKLVTRTVSREVVYWRAHPKGKPIESDEFFLVGQRFLQYQRALATLNRFLRLFIKKKFIEHDKQKQGAVADAFFENMKIVARSLMVDLETKSESAVTRIFARNGFGIKDGNKLKFLSLYKNLPERKPREGDAKRLEQMIKEYREENYTLISELKRDPLDLERSIQRLVARFNVLQITKERNLEEQKNSIIKSGGQTWRKRVRLTRAPLTSLKPHNEENFADFRDIRIIEKQIAVHPFGHYVTDAERKDGKRRKIYNKADFESYLTMSNELLLKRLTDKKDEGEEEKPGARPQTTAEKEISDLGSSERTLESLLVEMNKENVLYPKILSVMGKISKTLTHKEKAQLLNLEKEIELCGSKIHLNNVHPLPHKFRPVRIIAKKDPPQEEKNLQIEILVEEPKVILFTHEEDDIFLANQQEKISRLSRKLTSTQTKINGELEVISSLKKHITTIRKKLNDDIDVAMNTYFPTKEAEKSQSLRNAYVQCENKMKEKARWRIIAKEDGIKKHEKILRDLKRLKNELLSQKRAAEYSFVFFEKEQFGPITEVRVKKKKRYNLQIQRNLENLNIMATRNRLLLTMLQIIYKDKCGEYISDKKLAQLMSEDFVNEKVFNPYKDELPDIPIKLLEEEKSLRSLDYKKRAKLMLSGQFYTNALLYKYTRLAALPEETLRKMLQARPNALVNVRRPFTEAMYYLIKRILHRHQKQFSKSKLVILKQEELDQILRLVSDREKASLKFSFERKVKYISNPRSFSKRENLNRLKLIHKRLKKEIGLDFKENNRKAMQARRQLYDSVMNSIKSNQRSHYTKEERESLVPIMMTRLKEYLQKEYKIDKILPMIKSYVNYETNANINDILKFMPLTEKASTLVPMVDGGNRKTYDVIFDFITSGDPGILDIPSPMTKYYLNARLKVDVHKEITKYAALVEKNLRSCQKAQTSLLLLEKQTRKNLKSLISNLKIKRKQKVTELSEREFQAKIREEISYRQTHLSKNLEFDLRSRFNLGSAQLTHDQATEVIKLDNQLRTMERRKMILEEKERLFGKLANAELSSSNPPLLLRHLIIKQFCEHYARETKFMYCKLNAVETKARKTRIVTMLDFPHFYLTYPINKVTVELLKNCGPSKQKMGDNGTGEKVKRRLKEILHRRENLPTFLHSLDLEKASDNPDHRFVKVAL